jgi:signal transduction histidine kinase
MRRQFTTLRGRLLAGTLAAVAATLLAAGVAVYVFVRVSLVGELDRALESSARALGAMIEFEGGQMKMEPEAVKLAEFNRRRSPDYFAVWLPDGRVVARSNSVGDEGLPHPTPPPGSTVVQTVTLPDGKPGHQATLTFVPPVDNGHEVHSPGTIPVTLTVAWHVDEVGRKLTRLAWLLAGTGAGATLAAAAAMVWVVRRGLRPLEALAARIETTGRDQLAERIELADAPGELTGVVLRLNELLDRVERTVVRERRFTADVAHELRTPLAGLTATLDVCAARRRMPEEYERTIDKCSAIVRSMGAMVENLMTLARADARQLPVRASRTPLKELVDNCWATYEPAAAARGVAAVFQVDDDLTVQTDAEKLRIVVNNLLDNAVSHADAGGWLRVHARDADDGSVELRVSNSGSRLTAEQAGRAFDRFWRGDAARSETGVHCGLGLSLCREVTTLLGGAITATSDPGGVFEVCLRLPAPASPPLSRPDAPRHTTGDRAYPERRTIPAPPAAIVTAAAAAAAPATRGDLDA